MDMDTAKRIIERFDFILARMYYASCAFNFSNEHRGVKINHRAGPTTCESGRERRMMRDGSEMPRYGKYHQLHGTI